MRTMSLRMSSWNLNMTRCRAVIGVFLHEGNALLAACTAALNSSSVVRGTRETTSWVAWRKKINKKNYQIIREKEAGATQNIIQSATALTDGYNSTGRDKMHARDWWRQWATPSGTPRTPHWWGSAPPAVAIGRKPFDRRGRQRLREEEFKK